MPTRRGSNLITHHAGNSVSEHSWRRIRDTRVVSGSGSGARRRSPASVGEALLQRSRDVAILYDAAGTQIAKVGLDSQTVIYPDGSTKKVG